MTDIDRPASEHPVLRKATASVLKGTILEEALAPNDIAQLVTDLTDSVGDGTWAISDVLTTANVDPDYAWELAERIYNAVLTAAVDI